MSSFSMIKHPEHTGKEQGAPGFQRNQLWLATPHFHAQEQEGMLFAPNPIATPAPSVILKTKHDICIIFWVNQSQLVILIALFELNCNIAIGLWAYFFLRKESGEIRMVIWTAMNPCGDKKK